MLSSTKLSGAAFLSVIISGQLIGEITSMTVHGEDAPELLTTSPNSTKRLTHWKLIAAMVIGLPVMLFIPLLLISFSVAIAATTLLLTLLAGCLAAVVELSLSKQIPRRKFVTRRSGSWVSSILSLLISASLGATCSYLVSALL